MFALSKRARALIAMRAVINTAYTEPSSPLTRVLYNTYSIPLTRSFGPWHMRRGELEKSANESAEKTQRLLSNTGRGVLLPGRACVIFLGTQKETLSIGASWFIGSLQVLIRYIT